MKRMLTLLLALALVLGMAPACAEGAQLSFEQAADMAQYLREAAAGDYLELKGVPVDMQRRAAQWAGGLEGDARLVVRLHFGDHASLSALRVMLLQEHPMVVFEAESSFMIELVALTFSWAAMESQAAEASYEEIAEINDALRCGRMYAEDCEQGAELYLVLHEEAQPILILAIAENGAVDLSAWFVPGPKLNKCKSAGEVAMWYMRNGLFLSCSEVSKE